jgi:hypothetical protein
MCVCVYVCLFIYIYALRHLMVPPRHYLNTYIHIHYYAFFLRLLIAPLYTYICVGVPAPFLGQKEEGVTSLPRSPRRQLDE